MEVYVAGSIADVAAVREVQQAVTSAGHHVVLDWTRGLDVSLTDPEHDPDAAALVARADLAAVLQAEALVVVAHDHPGRGMFVELGAALARVESGEQVEVVVVGPGTADSVFYFHPAVRRYATVDEWLATA